MEKITSRRNPLCAHFKKLGMSRSYREGCGEFFCDGIKLLEEALKCEADVPVVFAASNIPFPLPLDTRLFYADRSLIDYLSPLKSAQETIFSCKIPVFPVASASSGTRILLDGVQDPGNVGSILRTAFAFGVDSVILTGGCADPYNPKAVRASMGAIFRQAVCHMGVAELAGLRRVKGAAPVGGSGARFIGAVSASGAKPVSEVALKGAVITIGSEGGGLSDDILSLCDEFVTIPVAPECESLNAATAAAILMWEAR